MPQGQSDVSKHSLSCYLDMGDGLNRVTAEILSLLLLRDFQLKCKVEMEGASLFVCIPLGTFSKYFSKIEEIFVTDQPAENAHKAKSCTSQILLTAVFF